MQHEDLLKILTYNPETGVFTRKTSRGNTKAGSILGCLDKKGYLTAMVLHKYVKLHRLAWFYVYSIWPTQIDHINQVKTDNRITNLREVSTMQNCLNQLGPRKTNKLQTQGVHQIKKTGRFRVCCSAYGVKQHLGVFSTLEEAKITYDTYKNNLLKTI